MLFGRISHNNNDIRLLKAERNLDNVISSFGDVVFWQPTAESGLVAPATNPALAEGRNIVINGGFDAWTADNPDSWAVTEIGDATSKVTQNPAGQCQIISDGTGASINQVILEIGKEYNCTCDLTVAFGDCSIGSSGGAGAQIFNSTQSVDFTFTATTNTFTVKRNNACDVTVDNISVKQINIAASSAFSDPLNNPLSGAVTGVAIVTGAGGIPYWWSNDGIDDSINLFSTEINSWINWDAGSIIVFAQSDTWATGDDYLWNFSIDANNGIYGYRSGTDIVVVYKQGGTAKSVTIASGSPTGVFSVGISWAYPGNLTAYYNGAIYSSPVALTDVIVGNLASTLTTFMSLNNTPDNCFAGNAAPLMLSRSEQGATFFSDIHNKSGV